MVGHLSSKSMLRRRRLSVPRKSWLQRRGSATIDYFLLIAIILPLAAFLFRIAPRAMHSVYDLLTVLVAWPFL